MLSWNLPSCQQMALQSFLVAVITRRSVVAATLKFGNCFTASPIMSLKACVSIWEMLWSTPLTSNPSEAVKSSSLPIMTSTYLAISWLTARALA